MNANSFFTLVVVFFATFSNAQTMKETDITLVENLFKDFLFRPNAKQQFVMVKVKVNTVWGNEQVVERWGWLNEPKSTVFFTDGESIEVSECDTLAPTDFKKYLAQHQEETETFARMSLQALAVFPPSDLVLAAWAYALDYKELSIKSLAKARKALKEGAKDKELVEALKSQLAWTAFAGMVHNYMVRKDRMAYEHGLRFQKLYLDFEKEYPQARAILQELERRKTIGKFNNQAQDSVPAEFGTWALDKQIDYLIESLDEIDQRQWGQPGGVSLGEDWRIQALIGIGDTAVPKLIGVIENDTRFTRSVHFWRDFANNRTVLNVKEAALTAIMSIWQDPIFTPVATGDNFTSRGQEQAKNLAIQLRAQQQKYVGKSLDIRKMETLQNPKEEMEARRAAAQDLVRFGYRKVIGTTVWSGGWVKQLEGKNPLIDRWNAPTLAEAIWKTMLDDLAQFDKKADYADKDYYRQNIEQYYLSCLIELNDPRILPNIQTAYRNAQTPEQLHQFAYTAYWLGDTTLWTDYCGLLQHEKIKLPKIEYSNGSIEWSNPIKQRGNRILTTILGDLKTINNDISQQTYQKITTVGHSFYPWIELRILQLTGGYDDEDNTKEVWYAQDLCLPILEKNLDNTKESDIQLKYYHKSGITTIMDWGGQSGLRLHPHWEYSDFSNGKDVQLRARICDMAANKLYQLVWGMPACHAHMKDKDMRIAQQKEFLKRFRELRSMTNHEYSQVNELYAGTRYIPNIPRLPKPATAEDVAAGKALFHLSGKGALADIQLPAVAIQAKDEKVEKPLKIYILQAELDEKGAIVYGTLTEDGVKIFKAGELINITPVPAE